MRLIQGIITFDGDTLSIDKFIQPYRSTQICDLIQNLLHFSFCQRHIVQTVFMPIVIEQNLSPVVDQVFLCRITQHF